MDSEYIYALQSWYLGKYTDLFKVITHLGGCIMQQQLCRLLYKNKTDCKQCSTLVEKLVECKLLKVEKIGTSNVLILSYPVLRTQGIYRTAKINGKRLKTSALIMEKHLRSGIYDTENPVVALKKSLETSSALFFKRSGEAHMKQLYALMKAYEKLHMTSDGLKYQYNRADKRFSYDYRSQYRDDYKLDLNKEPDLYTLECKNIYLSNVQTYTDSYNQLKILGTIDMYLVSHLSPEKMAAYLIEAKRIVESTLQNDSIAIIDVYSHEAQDDEYIEKVYTLLEKYPEYILPDIAREHVQFHFFDSRRTLFGGVAPSSIR